MAQGCTTLQAGLTLSAALTANRQPSRRLVFNDISAICDSYRDSSLTLRMTVSGGKVSTKRSLTSIVCRLSSNPRPYLPSPNDATCWPGFKVFALCAGYAHTRARLRIPLQDFCLRKGAMALHHAALVTQAQIP